MPPKILYNPDKKIWNGEKTPYPYNHDSVGEIAYKTMLSDLQHVCQINDDSGEIYTNERLLKAGVSVANALIKQGIKKGDIIVVLMHSEHYTLPTFFGCMLAGAIVCPFHYSSNNVKDDLKNILEKVQPRMMITTYVDLVETFKTVFDTLNIQCPIYMYENKIHGCHDLKPLLEDHFAGFETFTPAGCTDPAKDIAILILSSATTGKAKLINCSHKQVLLQLSDDGKNMTMVTTTQPGWQSDFLVMSASLVKGVCRIIRNHSTIDQILLMFEKYKSMLAFVKPQDIFEMLKTETIKKVDLSEMIVVVSTGQHLSMKLANEFQQYLPNGLVISLYGTSELGGGTSEASDLDPDIPSLVGKIKRNFDYYVIDEAGNRLGPNEVGELCISSSAPFIGYYKDPERSKSSVTKDGFFLTEDLGYIDEYGNIFLSERKKFVINYRGMFLNQWNVEKIIIENVKGIDKVCVVDIESDEHGVVPYIAIVSDHGVVLKESDIIKTVMENHPFKFETRVFFFDDLPLTISGKYKKYVIRDMILKKMSEQ